MGDAETKVRMVVFLTAMGLAMHTVCGAETATVGQYGMFEQSLRNDRPYQDPYRDVTLAVTYRHSVGGEIRFWGFYDGGQTWKIRFLPHLTGTWHYEAVFSDGAPGLKGTFRCTSVPNRVGINRANPIWFRRGVEPLLIRGFHVGDRFFAENWSAESRTAFLDWAQKQGYNLLSIASHYLNRDSEGRGRGWNTPQLWPLNAAEFQKMERILNEAAARRFVVYPFAGFFGQRSNYPRRPADQERYVRYVLARLGPYWNVLWNVAGPEPNAGKGWMSSVDVVRLGQLIRSLDVFDHPLSVHNRGGDDPYRDADWSTFVTLQGPKKLNRKELSAGLLRNLNPGKPLLAQETLWSGNKNHPAYSDADLRKNAFVIMLSGASLIFGDMAGDSSSGFSGTMDLAQRNQKRHDILKNVWDFLESVRYQEMRPRQDLVDNGYCLAQAGREYLVYLESRGVVNVAIENGPYGVRWINAANLADRRDGGTTGAGANLRSPEDGDDWVLHLVRTGTGLPDQIHLSWQQEPSSSLTITWHTAAQDNPATVEYRPQGADSWRRAAGTTFASPQAGWLHRVTLDGLRPATVYEYRVSSDRGVVPAESRIYPTQTAPNPGPADFTFAFLSDTGLIGRVDGNAAGASRIMRELLQDAPLFVLGGGDYAYANRDGRFSSVGAAVDEWFVQWQDVLARFPFLAQYGNHEIHLTERFENWAPRFAPPAGFDEGRNYAFNVGDVHFTGLFAPGGALSAAQLQWLDADLAAARQKGTRWLLVFQHEPIYSHGSSHPAAAGIRAALAPVFEKHRVDLHLSCHDQNYERTYPLRHVPDDPTPGSTSLDRYPQGQGVIYAKISPSGKRSEIGNQFSQFTTKQQPFMAKRETGFYHYGLIHVRARGELEVVVYRMADAGAPRTIADRFVLY